MFASLATFLHDLGLLVSTQAFHIACLIVILGGCILAVLTRSFDDTMAQRAAFMLTALGAVLQLSLVVKTGYTSPGYGLMLAGCALYVASTALKVWRRWRSAGRPGHPLRRSTDRMPLDSGAGPLPSAWPVSESGFPATVPMPGRRRGDAWVQPYPLGTRPTPQTTATTESKT